MTDWEKQLGRRAATVDRAKEALDADIAAARLDGASFREIGRWAKVNHERARSIAKRINGHTDTGGAPITEKQREQLADAVRRDIAWDEDTIAAATASPEAARMRDLAGDILDEEYGYGGTERPASSEEKTT